MMIRGPRMAALLLVLLVLGGCAAVQETGPDARRAAYEERRETVAALTHWRAVGRAAITTPEDSVTLSLDWRQAADAYRVDLRGPFGAGSVRLQGNDQGVILRTSEGTRERADDAASLLQRHTGLDLPVDVLPWWLRGLPSPALGVDALALDGQGRVQRMEQAGWVIEYDGYDARGGPVPLPVRLSMEGPGVSLRAHIRSWEVGRDGT
ncbi:lipoprotein insertase outer membrane protein LolB [Aquisalimonas lutea]|uniref:lipoprotein insertase outer membrane protein LolB n=1 Tax=Aquisalimonas lutea TaxID=1327750 RepID=UPI0025B56CA2|nr:lipoprotein insertase outer membrane protein LolB [Aquisalimonas lutea]MDN3516014.1 lipoprotein insertase outer membrane protein LolB [Aquisalimonas lutea]